MTTLSYSQSLYPKKIVLNGDTGVFVTPNQIILSNKKMILGEYYKAKSDTLEREKIEYLESIDVFKNIVAELNSRVDIKSDQLLNCKKKNEKTEEINEKEAKRDKWKERGIGAVVGFLIALAICL